MYKKRHSGMDARAVDREANGERSEGSVQFNAIFGTGEFQHPCWNDDDLA